MKFFKTLILAAMVVAASASVVTEAKLDYVYEDAEAPQEILNISKVELYPGGKVSLKLADAKVVKWSSNGKDIATVSKKGRVTAIGAGTCNVSAVDEDGKVYTCLVTVKEPELNKPNGAYMYSGKTLALKLNGAKVVSWTSSDEGVAKVNSKGTVVAQKVSETKSVTITCTDKAGNAYECKITVVPAGTKVQGATVEEIKQTLGEYELNTIYEEDDKVFMYYATNGAFGEVPDFSELEDKYNTDFPFSNHKYSVKCALQYCSGLDANNWCDFSVYYIEYAYDGDNSSGTGTSFRTVVTAVGDTLYNYFDERQLEKTVKLTKKNFPELYGHLLQYDLNADGWLCVGEIERITDLKIGDAAFKNIKGIKYLTSLYSLSIGNFTGKKINLKNNASIKFLKVNANTSSIKVDAPNVEIMEIDTYWSQTLDGMEPSPIKSINVSGCTGATSLILQPSNTECEYKLPSKSDALKSLKNNFPKNKSFDFSGYKNLEELSICYSKYISSIDLSKNKKIATVSGYSNDLLKSGAAIKLPNGKNVEVSLR